MICGTSLLNLFSMAYDPGKCYEGRNIFRGKYLFAPPTGYRMFADDILMLFLLLARLARSARFDYRFGVCSRFSDLVSIFFSSPPFLNLFLRSSLFDYFSFFSNFFSLSFTLLHSFLFLSLSSSF